MLQLYHAKAETRQDASSSEPWSSLQLYHAKAETTASHCDACLPGCVATLPCQSGNDVLGFRLHNPALALQLYHAKAETEMADFPLLKQSLLQLYHAKAETRYPHQGECLQSSVATLPCQSGNCVSLATPLHFPPALQLYHAKAETVDSPIPAAFVVHVATLPCQSGNNGTPHVVRLFKACCNFTMPKRKRRIGGGDVDGLCELQLYHAKAETRHYAN